MKITDIGTGNTTTGFAQRFAARNEVRIYGLDANQALATTPTWLTGN